MIRGTDTRLWRSPELLQYSPHQEFQHTAPRKNYPNDSHCFNIQFCSTANAGLSSEKLHCIWPMEKCVLRMKSSFPRFISGKAVHHLTIKFQASTERRGRVVSTPASYSGDPGLKYRPGDRLILTEGFVVFLSPCRKIPG
jgi:hypothetical protein